MHYILVSISLLMGAPVFSYQEFDNMDDCESAKMLILSHMQYDEQFTTNKVDFKTFSLNCVPKKSLKTSYDKKHKKPAKKAPSAVSLNEYYNKNHFYDR